MARKIEKALYGPSLVEVVLGAILGLVAGVGVAAIYLVFKPVATVKELPKEQLRGAVYYIPGSEGRTKGAAWEAKQKLFIAGKSVQLVEEELNAWLAASLKLEAPPAPKAAPKGGAPAPAGPPPPDAIFIPSKPNFRVVNDRLQLGLNCTLNWYGVMTDVTFQSSGGFKREGDHFVYAPDKVYLGSCPLHLIPAVSDFLLSHLAAKAKVPDEFRTAWHNLANVEVSGGALKLAAAP